MTSQQRSPAHPPRVLDGAIGCWTRFRGGRLSEHPLGDTAQVVALHRASLAAGASALRTASFALPAARSEGWPEAEVARALSESIGLARIAIDSHVVREEDASEPPPRLLISLGPTGLDGDSIPTERTAPYSLLGRLLARSDGPPLGPGQSDADPAVVLETFRSLDEIERAIDGLRVGGHAGETWVLVSPDLNGRLGDADLKSAGRALAAHGLAAAGIGCAIAEVSLAQALEQLRDGFGGPLVFSPAVHGDGCAWAEQTARIATDADVQWVGGCCGAGASHLVALRRAIQPLEAAPSVSREPA